MNRRKFICAVVSAAVASLAGCKSDDGGQFIGKWKRTVGNVTLEINRNGENFMLTDVGSDKKFPAKLNKEGLLEFSNGLSTITVSIEDKTGHLVFAGEEYVRME